MSFPRLSRAVYFILMAQFAAAQQSPPGSSPAQPIRDPRAVAALQQAVLTMGTAVPSDSTALGTVTIVAGSKTEQGTIRILTRGTGQTSEEVQTPGEDRKLVFSQGQASETVGTTATPVPLERAATSQCRDFPLPFLVSLLNNPDEVLQFVGPEQVGVSALHIRATNTYASLKRLQSLTEFSITDLWIDASSALPLKIVQVQRDGGGSAPRTRMEVFFADYQNTGGVLYPRTIQKSWNGTPWMTITVQGVTYNTGLTDADFPVAEVQK